MVQLATDETTLRVLIERLCWPLRLVRVRVAQEYGALLSHPKHRTLALKVYLEWLASRKMASEVVSGLCVLKCVPEPYLPNLSVLRGSINEPSILADMVVESVYGFGNKCGGWANAHSGTAPASFEPSRFFDEHKSAHVAPIMGMIFRDWQRKVGLDFPKQWAFEWQAVMDATSSPYSGYPYYFLNGVNRDSGVIGQFSQRQDEVFRTSFLRTIHWAMSHGMPLAHGTFLAEHTLPLNNDFANLRPVSRPAWLGTKPEDCCAEGADLERLCKEIIANGLAAESRLPVSIEIPISPEVHKFAAIGLTAVLASPDFERELPDASRVVRKLLILDPNSSFNGPLPIDEPNERLVTGEVGNCLPIVAGVFPDQMGFWHGEYFGMGIDLPMSYILPEPSSIQCNLNGLEIQTASGVVANWRVWHDNYSPLYPKGGETRCGMLTTMPRQIIADAENQTGRKLGWVVNLRVWASEKDYTPLIKSSRQLFFMNS